MTTAGQGRWKLLIQSPSTNLNTGEQPHVGYSRFSSREKALKYAGERLAPDHKAIRMYGPNGVSIDENEIENEIKERRANRPSAA
jgi:hypothetical protein